MGHHFKFRRGDKGATGVVDSAVYQRPVDFPDEFAPGCQVVLDDGLVVAVPGPYFTPGFRARAPS